jgi:LPXTG-motif cell wall-anchored protein
MKKFSSILLIFLIIFVFSGFNVFADEGLEEIDIATSPHKIFFNINNLKPGDSATKTLIVNNNGKQDFNYLFSNRFLTGSEKFYNEILLTISDQSNTVLFNGKIKDFEKLEPRFLKTGTSENFIFSIKVPFELGNEFQGLGSEFQFKFYVEGTLGGVLPVDGPKLPNTGSDMFNFLVVGAVLILTGSTFQFIVKRRSKLRKEV